MQYHYVYIIYILSKNPKSTENFQLASLFIYHEFIYNINIYIYMLTLIYAYFLYAKYIILYIYKIYYMYLIIYILYVSILAYIANSDI